VGGRGGKQVGEEVGEGVAVRIILPLKSRRQGGPDLIANIASLLELNSSL